MEDKDEVDEDPYPELLADLTNMSPLNGRPQGLQFPSTMPAAGTDPAAPHVHFHTHGAHGHRPQGIPRLGLRRRHLPGSRHGLHFHFRRNTHDDGNLPQGSGGSGPQRFRNVHVNIPSVNMPSVNIPSVNIPNILRRGEGGGEGGGDGGFNFSAMRPPPNLGGAKAAAAKQWARERRDAVRHRLHANLNPGSPQHKAQKGHSEEQFEEELRETWRRGFLNKPPPKRSGLGQGAGDAEKKEAKDIPEGKDWTTQDEYKAERKSDGRNLEGFSIGPPSKQEDGNAEFPSMRRGFLQSAANKTFRRRDRALSSEDVGKYEVDGSGCLPSGKDRRGQRGPRAGSRGQRGSRFVRSKSPGKGRRSLNDQGGGRQKRAATLGSMRRNSHNDLLNAVATPRSLNLKQKRRAHRSEKESGLPARAASPQTKHSSPRVESAAEMAMRSAEEQVQSLHRPLSPAPPNAKSESGSGGSKMASPQSGSPQARSREDTTEDNERWNCPICLGWFETPVNTPCDHTFCGTCLKGVIRQALFPQPVRPNMHPPGPQDPHCPLCREPFKPDQVRPDRQLYHEMAKARVRCPQDGCNEQFSPLHTKRHQDRCPMVQIQCPQAQFGCGYQGLRKDLAEHLVSCGYEKIKGLFPKIYTQMNQMRGAMHSMEQRLVAQQTVIASHNAILRELYQRSHFHPWHYFQLMYAVFWEPVKWNSQRDRWQSFSIVGATSLLYVLPVYLIGFALASHTWGNLFDSMVYRSPWEVMTTSPQGTQSQTPLVPLLPMGSEDSDCWAVKPGFALIILMLYSLALAGESWDLQRWVGAVPLPVIAFSWEYARYWLCLSTAWLTHALLFAQRCATVHVVESLMLVTLCLLLPFGLEALVRGQRIKVQGAVLTGLQWGFVLYGGDLAPTWVGLAKIALFAFLASHAAAALGGPKFLQGMATLDMTAEISPTMRLMAGCPNRSLRIASGWLLIAFGSFQVVMQGVTMLKPVIMKELILAVFLLLKFGMHTLVKKAAAPVPPPAHPQQGNPPERARVLACLRFAMCMSVAAYIALFINIAQIRRVYPDGGISYVVRTYE